CERGIPGKMNLAYAAVSEVSNIKVAGNIEGNADGIVKASIGGRAAIPRIAIGAIARYGCDDAVGIHPTNATIIPVSNIKVTEGIEGYTLRKIKTGIDGRAVIARIAVAAIARYRCDDPIGAHLANAVVAAVTNIQVSKGIQGHAVRSIKAGVDGQTAVRCVGCGSIACHGSNNAVMVHFANAVVALVSNKQIAEGIEGYATRRMKAGS